MRIGVKSMRLALGCVALALASYSFVGFAQSGQKQEEPCAKLRSHEAPTAIKSGIVSAFGDGEEAQVVFSKTIWVAEAMWIRLKFDEVLLAGDPASPNASYLKITSLKDGEFQTMRSHHLQQWRNTSAYFNGNSVLLELYAYPGTGPNKIKMTSSTVGDPPSVPESLCGSDDRVLSTDPRSSRHYPEGCSSWLHDDLNHTFATAGHCGVGAADVQQFNVPLSGAGGAINHPGPQDQYVVDGSSVQATSGTIGVDWCYFGCFANSTTGLTAFQTQGQAYVKAAAAPAVSGQNIRITGYGTTSSPVSPTWNQVQKTHVGPYASLSGTIVRYATDTTGGNSGSAVMNESNQTIIGIHTHAGCTSTGGSNQGTAIQVSGFQNALNNPLGICKSGRNPVVPPLFASGDLNNNFGTASTVNGTFGKVSEIAALMQGLAFNRSLGVFYGCDNGNKLYSINPTTGAATLLATISAGTTIHGLGFDPATSTLYGIAQSTGQLYTINVSNGAAAAIGAPGGGTVGGLDYDVANARIYAIDDTGGSKLYSINNAGVRTLVGTLGAGITDCNGLAWNDRDGQLYTINATNEQLLRINPAFGTASVVGATGGLFGPSYGMAVSQISAETISTASFVVTGGLLTGGNLASLLNIDSNRLSILGQELDPSPRLEVLSNSATTATTTKVEFLYTANCTRLDMAEISELWDWTANGGAGGWDPASTSNRAPTLSDSSVVQTVTLNPARFLSAGSRQLKSRLTWVPIAETTATDGWGSSINQTQWKVYP